MKNVVYINTVDTREQLWHQMRFIPHLGCSNASEPHSVLKCIWTSFSAQMHLNLIQYSNESEPHSVLKCIWASFSAQVHLNLIQCSNASEPHSVLKCIWTSFSAQMHMNLIQCSNASEPHWVLKCIQTSLSAQMHPNLIECSNASEPHSVLKCIQASFWSCAYTCSCLWWTFRVFVATCVMSTPSLSQAFHISETEHYTLEFLSNVTFYRSIYGPTFIVIFWLILMSWCSPIIYAT
jgi:hypothetical protein